MRSYLIFILLIYSSCSERTDTPKNDFCLKFYDEDNNLVPADPKLIEIWKRFTSAILNKDTSELMKISTDCIHCVQEACGEARYVPTEHFFTIAYSQIFNQTLISRLNDTSKVKAHYYHDHTIFNESCFRKQIKIEKPKIAEVFVKYLDPTTYSEGADQIFEFI